MPASWELPARNAQEKTKKNFSKSQLTEISLELLGSIFIPGPGGWVRSKGIKLIAKVPRVLGCSLFQSSARRGGSRRCGSRCDGSVVESGESGGHRGLLKQGEGTQT